MLLQKSCEGRYSINTHIRTEQETKGSGKMDTAIQEETSLVRGCLSP